MASSTDSRIETGRLCLYIRYLLRCCLLLSMVLFYAPYGHAEFVSLADKTVVDLSSHGRLYHADSADFPATTSELPAWLAQRRSVTSVDLFGGAYWFYVEMHNDSDTEQWVVNPEGTLIEHIEFRLYPQTGATQRFTSGYRAPHDYLLHYGKQTELPAATRTGLLVYFESPYYASRPGFEIVQVPAYRQRVEWENLLVIAAFGALLTLALYNLFIFTITLDRTFLYYASYLLAYFVGWAFTFHVPADLLGWHMLELHYIPFFLLPVLNTLFYMRFLNLHRHFPRLAMLSKVNYWLPLILLPSCFLALPYAHMLATLVITYWLVIALVSGIASVRQGYRPARFFVLAFIALLIPGAIILPANVGLIPDLVRNSELLTLLGGTLDAILLAFALADKIRILSEQKDHAMQRLNDMLDVARTDHLTGIANRHAFDQDIRALFDSMTQQRGEQRPMLFLIDLDGLKRINDRYGHLRGDELLRTFARYLAGIENDNIRVYRLGGDEFTILVRSGDDMQISHAITHIETRLHEHDFETVGVSYGLAFADESKTPNELLSLADERMYRFKTLRRHARSEDNELDTSASENG